LTNDRPEELQIRCDLLKELKGRVLELGPGPATNAECFVGKPITHYTGIEPNTCVHPSVRCMKPPISSTSHTRTCAFTPATDRFFHPIFKNKTTPLGLEFPIELLTLEGESLGLPDESFDQVRS
jgi:hypothetical protein